MKQTFKELKSRDENSEACERIVRSVICRVERFEISRSRRRSLFFGAVSTIAVVAIVPIVAFILESSYRSGFGTYISLISSDSSYITQHLQEFLMSAASSLPIMGGMGMLLILFIFMNSLRRTVRYSDNANVIEQRLITT
jgi:hypothetical protein